MASMSAEIVLAFPTAVAPLRHMRSTLIHGGIRSLREAGLYDAYTALVPAPVREEIETAVAGMWIPAQTAVAHYVACDGLGLSAESATQIGRGTFTHTKGLLLGAAVGLARGAGVTPWAFVPHLQRFWLRGCDGGAVQAVKHGPKEVRLDVIACPMLKSQYFRGAMRGLVTSIFELASSKVYIQEQAGGAPETTIALRVQWV
jgi:hypothetical protein